MGFDFGIQRHRKGEAYESLDWEDVCWWRNCYDVKRIFLETIKTNDSYEYPLTIGAVQILIKKLSDEMQSCDFDDFENVAWDDGKLLIAIRDLSDLLFKHLDAYDQGIEYEYKVIDSF